MFSSLTVNMEELVSVLVTGGAGYIGSHMVWRLLDAGEEVLVIDRLSTGFDWAVAQGAELVIADTGNQALVEDLVRSRRVDGIIHFAGSIIVPESVIDPLGYYLNNTVRSRALLESAIRCGVRQFVFSSTAAVYGTPVTVPVAEDAMTHPESPYGTSKLMLRDAAAVHDFRYAALRYFNVSGADPAMRTGQSTKGATHLIKVACEAATGKRPYLEIYGVDYSTPDGTCIRDYIHVADLVEAHYLALQRLRSETSGSIVANCGYGRGYSVREVIETVRRLTGRDFDVRTAGRRSGDAVSVIADPTRAKIEFGWRPKYDSLDTIVAHTLQWQERLPQMLKSRSG
jgi:UDP-glucose 4-epimerase